MRSTRSAGPRGIGLSSSSSLRRSVAVITFVLSVVVVSNVVFGSIGGTNIAAIRGVEGTELHRTQQGVAARETPLNVTGDTPESSGRSRVDMPPFVDDTMPLRPPRGWFLVVIGIPSTDTSFGRKRRDLQRSSWMTYPGVWGRHSHDDKPRVAVQYLVGRHPEHNYLFSQSLLQESGEYGDIIPLALREGRPTTGKRSGGAGYWGLESEVGMSRKALMWYAIAPQLFPDTPYFMKCDDDVFVRVPQYVADLESLHQRVDAGRLYWGKVMKWGAVKGDPRSVFYFVGGMSITLARPLLDVINLFAPVQEHIGDFIDGNPMVYKAHNLDHEDVMVGRIFYETHTNVTVVKDCRYHDVHVGANVKLVTPRSLVVHHVREPEYAELLLRFPTTAVENTTWRPSSSRGPFQQSISPC